MFIMSHIIRSLSRSSLTSRNKVIFSIKAIERLKELNQITKQIPRIGVIEGGCSGLRYSIEMVSNKQPMDYLINEDGMDILIDKKVENIFRKLSIDYQNDKVSSKFIFSSDTHEMCGCGTSFKSNEK
jgi:iron-sulfur cluster assembly accessory protein